MYSPDSVGKQGGRIGGSFGAVCSSTCFVGGGKVDDVKVVFLADEGIAEDVDVTVFVDEGRANDGEVVLFLDVGKDGEIEIVMFVFEDNVSKAEDGCCCVVAPTGAFVSGACVTLPAASTSLVVLFVSRASGGPRDTVSSSEIPSSCIVVDVEVSDRVIPCVSVDNSLRGLVSVDARGVSVEEPFADSPSDDPGVSVDTGTPSSVVTVVPDACGEETVGGVSLPAEIRGWFIVAHAAMNNSATTNG
ncbi:hypothetical protein BaRGS_00021274 [Batillaria attramentaria]|uniref:Uncharacterized protein n=1 Tax=Batillaria attramentaria TaxID=370345 RepID=A0ABD0KJN3_9CAEN